MSFFGRAANLVKGGLKSLSRPGGDEQAARERALDEEALRPPRRVTETGGRAPSKEPAPPEPAPEGGRTPPERDEQGNVKRTL
ncbi:MAG: hypothetical protein Q8P18_07510 [Pseudomonadota bacterium]|nr:hypothetical protein [Pseudomonadota bacterium]